MRLHVSVDAWTARLFAVLALTPAVPLVACGGSEPGAGGGGTGGTGTTSSSTSGTIRACNGAIPVTIDGNPTGFVDCDGGWTYREAKSACPDKTPTTAVCGEGFGGGVAGNCTTDADCADMPHGHCEASNGPGLFCGCIYGCVTDADCGAGSICECGIPVGRCTSAECTSDADCGPGLCATYTSNPGCGGTAYACQSAEDECTGDGDCAGGMLCTWTGTHRVCVVPACTIGRPFLVAGEERLARIEGRGDWRADILSPSVGDLDPSVREALAARWTKVGLMEHASIAAFARFVLQLLSLGAPPDLVKDAQAAMADETRHAEVCFALASAYAGASWGPGPLPIDRAMESSDLRSVLVTAIHEGCVGETVAAIEAAETAERATDPAVRAVLLGIAEDETRHAELAWRFVRWALTESPSLAHAVEEAFADALSRPRGHVGEGEGDARLLAHGAPGEGLRWEIRRGALDGVVGPCARAMLASVADSRDELPPTRRVGRQLAA
jgi:hypothetical protein